MLRGSDSNREPSGLPSGSQKPFCNKGHWLVDSNHGSNRDLVAAQLPRPDLWLRQRWLAAGRESQSPAGQVEGPNDLARNGPSPVLLQKWLETGPSTGRLVPTLTTSQAVRCGRVRRKGVPNGSRLKNAPLPARARTRVEVLAATTTCPATDDVATHGGVMAAAPGERTDRVRRHVRLVGQRCLRPASAGLPDTPPLTPSSYQLSDRGRMRRVGDALPTTRNAGSVRTRTVGTDVVMALSIR